MDGVRDSHGTSCAGIIAMEKDNDVCGVGVAYRANITGMYMYILHQHYLVFFVTRLVSYIDPFHYVGQAKVH